MRDAHLVSSLLTGRVLLTAFLAAAPSVGVWGGTVTVFQCNVNGGAAPPANIAALVAGINPAGSPYPPVAVIGMQELMTDQYRMNVEAALEQATAVPWESVRVPQGVDRTSGIGFFWRPDLLEYRSDYSWDLGTKVLEQIDNGYVIKFTGRLFRRPGTEEALGVFTGKLVWGGAILRGQEVTDQDRQLEAAALKSWILNGDPDAGPGMTSYPSCVRVIPTDLNADTGTGTWDLMKQDYEDPSYQHTAWASLSDFQMDVLGMGYRIDYVWWDYDSGAKQSGGFADGPRRSADFGSDHRAVWATVNLHAADVTPPEAAITNLVNGQIISTPYTVTASATDASGIQKVEWFIDDVSRGVVMASPWEYLWDPAGYAGGTHPIYCTATDNGPNHVRKQSAAVYAQIGEPATADSIAAAKEYADGIFVTLPGKVVSTNLGPYFYIEEPDRSSGIKVSNTSSFVAGDTITVTGKLATLNKERQLNTPTITPTGHVDPLAPLALTNLALGGGPLNSRTPGVRNGTGVNNIGLLVTTWGTVKARLSGSYIYLDDGAAIKDGTGNQGVRVDISSLSGYTAPPLGAYVVVTGISSTHVVSSEPQRKVKVVQASDIRAAPR